MLMQPTLEQLNELRLHTLAQAWQAQHEDPSTEDLGFDERLALLVEAEWMDRQNKRLGRLLREAKLRIAGACLEDLEYAKERKLERAQIRQLATGRWIEAHQNCALAQQACRRGHRVLYRRMPRLFDELTLARADGTYVKLLARFARTDVLVLDDWGLAPVQDVERRDLLEIMEDRHGLRSTIWEVARPPRRPDRGRRDLRSAAPQRSPDRATRAVPKEGRGEQRLKPRPATSAPVHDHRSG
jgi:DNA replication protein DnaC